MEGKKTLLYQMLSSPKTHWEKGGIYRLILMIPTFLLTYTFGIIFAIAVDWWVAVIDVGD